MIAAINASGRGLTATFTTATQAGSGNTGTDTGIMISGNVNITAASVAGAQELSITSGAYDTSVSATAVGGTPLTADNSGGIATIGYTASAGANLTSNNLTSQGGAEAVSYTHLLCAGAQLLALKSVLRLNSNNPP